MVFNPPHVTGGDDADADWCSVDHVFRGLVAVAFDHRSIILDAFRA